MIDRLWIEVEADADERCGRRHLAVREMARCWVGMGLVAMERLVLVDVGLEWVSGFAWKLIGLQRDNQGAARGVAAQICRRRLKVLLPRSCSIWVWMKLLFGTGR
ncbi:hypothetical protein ACLOJK_035015 [Asimina triloba]